MKNRHFPTARVLVASLAATLLLTSCTGQSEETPDGNADGGQPLTVVTGFYPMQYAIERVGGEHVAVTNLSKPGAEPHDLELAPADVAAVAEADLVVYLAGFQPAIDSAVASEASEGSFDVTDAATLALAEHSDQNAGDADSGALNGMDPHFWLDPTKLGKVASAIANELSRLDPVHAEDFSVNAATLVAELNQLDADFAAGLADCTSNTLVTDHEAFAYLANRYGFQQRGVSGVNPDSEASTGELADLVDFIRTNSVTTIYYEAQASPDVAYVIANETGAKTLVLDPIESLSEATAATDYLAIMRVNLASLRSGQGCT